MIRKVILATLMLMFIVSTIVAASAGKETLLAQNQRLVLGTEIDSHLVTWYETAWNSPHIYDLTTKKMLNPPTIDGVASSMKVYNNNVVWSDMSSNVMLYNSSTNKVKTIGTGYDADVYGDNIVYDHTNSKTSEHSVFLYNITTKKSTQLIKYGNYSYSPRIYGNKVVWSRRTASGTSNIYIYDIKTRQMSTISATGHAYDPEIYGNIVVWTENSGTTNNIYMRDISISKTTQITKNGISSTPKVYGNRIVYTSEHYTNSKDVCNVYMYDKSTGKNTQITNSNYARNPSIYNNKIVYEDFKNTDRVYMEVGNIYMYDISVK